VAATLKDRMVAAMQVRTVRDADRPVNIEPSIRRADPAGRHRMIERVFRTPRGYQLAEGI
jgi:hypothetical protein